MKVRKFEIEDYFNISRRRFDMLTFLNFPEPRRIAQTLGRGEAYTASNGTGGIVACGGVVPFWKGVGEVWMVTSPLVLQHKVWFIRTVAGEVERFKEGYERLQTVIDAEHDISRRWAEWMGFINEGVMRKYIGGRDYVRYAWVKE